MNIKGLKTLFTFDGYCLTDVAFSSDVVQVHLAVDKRRKAVCPHCGAVGCIEGREVRQARDMAIGLAKLVFINYPAQKIRCNSCGKRSWGTPAEIDSHRGATTRFMCQAAFLMCFMSVRKAGDALGLSDTRLRRWDKAVLKSHLGAVNKDDLEVLLVDEKSVGRGHHYVTAVLNGKTGDLLFCHEGKRKSTLKLFFDSLTLEQKSTIQVVCMDRGGAYHECVKEELPDADIAFDKFHLVSNFNDVVDSLRRQEWNRFREEKDKGGEAVLKGQRYNLFRRPEKNTPEQQARLEELLKANETLSKAYILLDDFRDTLSQRYISGAKLALRTWVETAMDSGVDLIEKFARKMASAEAEIINAVRYKVSNGPLEGFNNLISRLIHRANGYTDMEYLALKCRQAALPDELKVPLPQK